MTFTDYRTLLKHAFESRLSRRTNYSLRAFARDLEMTPQQLSLVFNGHKGLSPQKAKAISRRITLNSDESECFLASVQALHARSAKARALAKQRLTELKKHSNRLGYSQLSLDAFRVISGWHHFGLMELVKRGDHKKDHRAYARELDVSDFEVDQAFARLRRLEAITETSSGYQCEKNFEINPQGVPSDAVRSFHRQILNKAIESIDLQNVEERTLSSTLKLVDRRRIPEAQRWIQKMRRDFDRKFAVAAQSPEGAAIDLYALGIQFFRMSKITHEPFKKGEKSK